MLQCSTLSFLARRRMDGKGSEGTRSPIPQKQDTQNTTRRYTGKS